MKLVIIWFRFEYGDAVEKIMCDQDLCTYVLHERIAGSDKDGRHNGSKAFPGQMSAAQVRVPDDKVDPLLDSLQQFRESRKAHEHLEALVLPVEKRL